MEGQCRRQWVNIELSLGQHTEFAGVGINWAPLELSLGQHTEFAGVGINWAPL